MGCGLCRSLASIAHSSNYAGKTFPLYRLTSSYFFEPGPVLPGYRGLKFVGKDRMSAFLRERRFPVFSG